MAQHDYASSGQSATERSYPLVKDRIVSTRDNLLELRSSLIHTLGRLRGHELGGVAPADPKQQPDPDHVVFYAEQIVQLSNDCQNLSAEIGTFV